MLFIHPFVRNTVLAITCDRLSAGPSNLHQVCITWRPRSSSMMGDLDLFFQGHWAKILQNTVLEIT